MPPSVSRLTRKSRRFYAPPTLALGLSMLGNHVGGLIHMQFYFVHDWLRSLCYFLHLARIESKPVGLIYLKDVLGEHVVIT